MASCCPDGSLYFDRIEGRVRLALNDKMRHVAMQRAIDQIGENRKAEAASRAANTPTTQQLAQQLLASKRESIAAQQGRVPLPVQISDV